MRRRLFREESLARRGQTESVDRLLKVTAPHEWVMLIALGLALIGVVLWGVFGSIERSLSVACVLVEPGERYPVVSDATGTLLDILAPSGGPVEVGQPIARVSTPGLTRHIAVARARLAAFESTEGVAPESLAAARAELLELESLQSSGELIVSPYTGHLVSQTLVTGRAVEAGAEVAMVRGGGGDIEAVALLTPEDARRLDEGMRARVLHAGDGREFVRALDAKVHEIEKRPAEPPGWLATFGLSSPANGRLARFSLTEAPSQQLADGDACSVWVVLSKDRLVQLLDFFRDR